MYCKGFKNRDSKNLINELKASKRIVEASRALKNIIKKLRASKRIAEDPSAGP